MGRLRDLTGQRFGKLTVIERAPNKTTGKIPHTMWCCRCDCGKIKTINSSNLVSNHAKSCGCASFKHGKTHKERLYSVWTSMRSRCNNKNAQQYKNYGGRGISICPEWDDYMSFREWAINNGYDENAPFGKCTLDRIDVNGDYCPENCRWVENKTQQNNKTSNRLIEFRGETRTMKQWSELLGIDYNLMCKRIECSKWDMERIVSTPSRRPRR